MTEETNRTRQYRGCSQGLCRQHRVIWKLGTSLTEGPSSSIRTGQIAAPERFKFQSRRIKNQVEISDLD